MKKILAIILFFISFKAKSQTPQAPIVFTDTTQMSNYAGSYALGVISDSAKIIVNPDGGWVSSMTYQVVANPAISYSSSDGDIQFTVNSNMDKCAKAFGNVLPGPIQQ